MKFAVVTGVSRGLGESVAKFFLESGIHVIGMSRGRSEILEKVANQNNVNFDHYSCDLGNVAAIEKTFTTISERIFSSDPDTVYLVNNAAVLEPVGQAMNSKSADLAYHFHVNTIAPIVLTNLFLQKGTEMDIPLISLNVTSGAAKRPVYGWSAYCSSKASINMYTQTVALEQDEQQTDHKIIAFSPGIMDTAMQETIRESTHEAFIEVDKFRGYKQKNLLSDTDAVGGVIVDIMRNEESIENGKIYDVKDYL